MAPSHSAPRRILVTGAAGFVGHHLLPRLRAAFPTADLVTPGAAPPGTAGSGAPPQAARLDITNPADVAALVDAAPPDAVLHLAAISHLPSAGNDPDLAWRVNLTGTLVLARAIQKANPGASFVYISSAELYGRSFALGHPLDETALPAPMNTYAATKAAADLALGAMAATGLRAIRLRPFNHTGPGQSPNFVVPAFARQVARIAAGLQEPRLQVGALDPLRDFLDVRDVCDAYVAALAHAPSLAPGTILNLASGTPRRIGGVLDDLIAQAGITAEISTGTALLRKAEIPTASGNATAAQAALGWSPQIPWNQTLRDVLDDWRERVKQGE